jgi:glycosyltransferase involved in cell wall biosynthesis
VSYERFIRDLIRSYQIEDRVILLGHVGIEKKQSLYKDCDIFLMPSLHENFGLAAAEAMASGLPVILSDQVGLAPYVQKWGGGIVVPVNDAVALAQAIVGLSQDLSRMGRAAEELIDTHFNSDIFSTSLLAMYQNALTSQN